MKNIKNLTAGSNISNSQIMKTFFSMKPIIKWLRELSVVVAGIALTFGITYLVSIKNNNEDMKQYLAAIKMEMEQNADEFDFQARMFNKSVRYANYLKTNNYTSLDKDSLFYYAYTNFTDGDGFGYMHFEYPISSMTNAFEMFKTSGVMRQMKNKKLLMLMWQAYTKMEVSKSDIKDCYKIKEEEIKKAMQLEAEGKSIDVPMKMFYSSDIPLAMESMCQRTANILRETISALEKAL